MAALVGCGILDTPEEGAFDEIARIAAEICQAPMALVSFVDQDRQWFKARVNLDTRETPRDVSFCAHALVSDEPLVVTDARNDARFADNPFVNGDPSYRFYAGAPIRIDGGSAIGTLCVFDHEPRGVTPGQVTALKALAKQIARELRMRREQRAQAGTVPAPPMTAAETSRTPPMLTPGTVVGKVWRIEKLLGTGASGAVFAARRDDGKRAAIKVLRPEWIGEEVVIERFVREARVMAQAKCKHVVRILDTGNLGAVHGSAPYLVLELLEGRDLASELLARGPLPWSTVVPWMIAVCDALSELHAMDIVHRDVKPSNVFLAKSHDAERPTVKLIDFGIAKGDVSPGVAPLTNIRGVLGSPVYMSPEQMQAPADVDGRSDVWSVAVTLYELMTGKMPFEGATEIALCVAVMTAPSARLRKAAPDAPEWLEKIVTRCLQKFPMHRFASAKELADELRAGMKSA